MTCAVTAKHSSLSKNSVLSLFLSRAWDKSLGKLIYFRKRSVGRAYIAAAAAVQTEHYLQCLEAFNVLSVICAFDRYRHKIERAGIYTASAAYAGSCFRCVVLAE